MSWFIRQPPRNELNLTQKIVGELLEMSRDTVELVRKAVVENRRAYVLVNNRSEGNAPLTVQALRESLG
jgi:hypothetical protein